VVSLPGGEPVIDIALAQEPRRPIVIAASSGKLSEGCARAIAAGADLATTRPHDIERMAPMMLAAARLHEERRLARNARGNEAVLRAKIEELSDPDIRGLQPFETFQRVLELEFKRAKRFEYPLSVALFAVEVAPPPPPAGIRGILRARAGNALVQTIRDIDLATQLDHERFLVLLPYTDLTGATGLGRRVIAAVAKGDPVISGGRSFPPRVVGAVAGARPGQDLSFSRLMKDATQALAQARKDGADLAVQPSL
jgi:two-component system, cell cycle response regulator